MANMNMIIHDMEGEIQIGDTFRKPKFRKGNRLQTFDRVVCGIFTYGAIRIGTTSVPCLRARHIALADFLCVST